LRVCVKPAAGTSPTNRPDALVQLGRELHDAERLLPLLTLLLTCG